MVSGKQCLLYVHDGPATATTEGALSMMTTRAGGNQSDSNDSDLPGGLRMDGTTNL